MLTTIIFIWCALLYILYIADGETVAVNKVASQINNLFPSRPDTNVVLHKVYRRATDDLKERAQKKIRLDKNIIHFYSNPTVGWTNF